MGCSRWVHLDVTEVLRETDKALLLEVGDKEAWVPKSHIADADQYAEGDQDLTISVTEWIAREKGLEVSD